MTKDKEVTSQKVRAVLLLIEGEKCSLEGTHSLLGCCKYSLPFFSGDYTCVNLIYSL